MKSNQIHMIIDGDNLYRDAVRLLGRGPHRHERLDYEGLLREAARLHGGESPVMAEYIQREHPGAGGFYHALNDMQYQLRLVPDEDGWEAQKLLVLSRLEALQQTDCDVLYVGGDSFNGKITSALRDLAVSPDGSERTVAVANFARLSEIDDPAFKHLDLVHDLHAAPTRVYDARKAAVTVAAVADTLHLDHTRPDAEDNDPNAPLEERLSPRSGRPLLILGDMENIDHGVAALMPSGKPERAFRPHWDRLQQFAMNHTHGAQVRLVPFLQYHGTVPAFARYMRRELGAHPVVLNPEYSPDRPSQRRSVVDEAIYAVLNELVDRVTDVAIVSNDGGYLPRLQALRENGIDADRRFLMIGLREQMSRAYSDTEWIETLDLEHDIGAFDRELPSRFVLTDIDDFDPAAALGDFGLPAPPEHDDEAAGH